MGSAGRICLFLSSSYNDDSFFFGVKFWPLANVFQGRDRHNFEFGTAAEDALLSIAVA